MTEAFVAYLWRLQYFDQRGLATTAGAPLRVLAPGRPNPHAGADFAEAQIELDGLRWAGAVEIHLRTSDWLRHGHQQNQAYDQVVLHVVWQNDLPGPLLRTDGSAVPLLELKPRTAPHLAEQFQLLQTSPTTIACAPQLPQVGPLTVASMFDKALAQRLERKARLVLAQLAQLRGDWEETAYHVLLANFGFKTNTEAFARLAQALPYRVLRKHTDSPAATEALLLGQAGWLPHPNGPPPDDYLQARQAEYLHLAHKYDLAPHQLGRHLWKLLRLRPANFPPVRLAQLAALLHRQPQWFAQLKAAASLPTAQALFAATQSDYWRQHYLPGQPAAAPLGGLGKTSQQNLLANTAVPLLAAYSLHTGEATYLDRAVAFLEQLPAERNHLTQQWAALGQTARHAAEAQAQIELINEFCLPKKCLACQIGAALVRPKANKNAPDAPR
ncbi:MAG: DUF2851 family protein [Bernardetiaceae bacterium]|jgi:hypothetical protein|nr:DUF2851 family protein [Bernardetiaceae bacterium]